MTEGTTRTIRELLTMHSNGSPSSRQAELAQLEACLRVDGPIVAWVHGASGS